MSSDENSLVNGFLEYIAQKDQSEYAKNDEFNSALDQRMPLEVVGFPVFGESKVYSFRQSEVLFWVDRKAYDLESEAYSSLITQERYAEINSYIRESGQKADLLALRDAVRKQRVVAFVGAGLSISSGYPDWQTALIELEQRVTGVEGDVSELLKEGKYLDAASLLWLDEREVVSNYIQSKFSLQESEGHRHKDVHKVLEYISPGCVVTTNFDRLIESFFESPFEGTMHGEQIGDEFVKRLTRGDRCLLKLHGDVDNPVSFILTKEQYYRAYGSNNEITNYDFEKPLPKVLRQIYLGSTLLFVGCSLEKDETVRLFEHIHLDQCFETPKHYAIIEEPIDARAKRDRASALLASSIVPIWYPHKKHEFVYEILSYVKALSRGLRFRTA